MASDSEGTESGHTRIDVEKIWTSGGLLLGYSGSTAVKQPLEAVLARSIEGTFGDAPTVDRVGARDALQMAAQPVLQQAYRSFVGYHPGQHAGHLLAGVLLVIGRDEQGYWMLELDGNNLATFYTAPGFHTVGSGSSAAYVAHGLMQDYLTGGQSAAHLRLMAHRTVTTCIDVLGGQLGVGGDVQLWHSEDNAPFSKAAAEEMRVLDDGLQSWTTIERESLEKVVLGDHAEPDEDVDIPEPLDNAGQEADGGA